MNHGRRPCISHSPLLLLLSAGNLQRTRTSSSPACPEVRAKSWQFWGQQTAKIRHKQITFDGSSRLGTRVPAKDKSMNKKSVTEAIRPKTDWARVDALTDEEIEESVRNDPDAAPVVDAEWFAGATLVLLQPKEQISIRLDHDVIEHFRRYPRYQTRINAILRAAMDHEKKAG